MRWMLALSLAAILASTACAPIARVEAGPLDASPAETGATGRAPNKASLADFEGDWSYANDCEFGHYANLSLKRSGNAVLGDWSDGTRVRGTDGLLRGALKDNRLMLELCTNGNERGAEPYCPAFAGSHDFVERRGDALIWYRHYDDVTQYLVLERNPLQGSRKQGCEEDQ
ncbi:hypothetical protein ACFPN1_15010 [Lysobacter yangpyeongensis]|uniref:Lipoprotein n=1 Tax=Lysobacter yangpyeongensis TaxID=346182 RepID=A0ABW0SQM3_9GAMM